MKADGGQLGDEMGITPDLPTGSSAPVDKGELFPKLSTGCPQGVVDNFSGKGLKSFTRARGRRLIGDLGAKLGAFRARWRPAPVAGGPDYGPAFDNELTQLLLHGQTVALQTWEAERSRGAHN